MTGTKRLFIAVDVPNGIKQSLAPALSQVAGVQWHSVKNFHITVKFIGDVPAELLPQLGSLMDFTGRNFPPFILNFSRLKAVESRLRLIIGNPQILADLRETFELNLKKIDLFHQDIIQFEPHITLGKVARDFQVPQINFDLSSVNFQVNEILLYETIRGRTEAEFVPLTVAKLQGK